MKTLPTGWSTYIDGSFTVFYVIQIGVVVGGSFLYFSTIDSDDIPSWSWDHLGGGRIAKNGLGIVSYKVDVRNGGGLGIVGEFDFKLLNQDNYYDILKTYTGIDKASIWLKRFILEQEPVNWSDGLDVFLGIITDIDYDNDFIYFHCIVRESDHKTIPRTLIEEKEFSSFVIPENSQGKPVPMQFGELERVQDVTTKKWSGGSAEAIFVNADETIEDGPGIATGGGNNYLDDSSKSWTTDEYADKDLEIIGGEGQGQLLVIKENTSTRLTVYDRFQTNPAAEGSVYQISDTQWDMIISDRPIKEYLLNAGGEKQFWFWDDSAKLYIPLNSKVLSTDDFETLFPTMAGWRFFAGVIKKNQIEFFFAYPFTELSNIAGWSNPNNAIDWDNGTYASFVISGGSRTPLFGRFGTNLYDMLGEWNDCFAYCVAEHDFSGGDSLFETWMYNAAGNLVDPGGGMCGQDILSATLKYNNIPKMLYIPPSGFPDGANGILSNLEKNGAGNTVLTKGDWGSLNYNRWVECDFHSTDDCTIKIYELGLIFSKILQLNEKSKIYVSIKGRMFEDTWDARKTAADLIENPADVIEKILRDDLGVVAGAINTTDFDTVSGTDRSGWKLAYSIMKEINSINEIQKICEEVFCFYFVNHEGKHTIKALKTSGSAAKTLSWGDVRTEGDDRKSTFEVKQSPREQVFNEFFVHYDKDPATGDYQKVAFIKNPSAGSYSANYVSTMHSGSDLYGNESTYWGYCHTSYSTYGFTSTKHIYLDRIRDDVTAENVLAIAIKWFYLRKAETRFKTQLQNCDLEIGDLVGLTDKLREDTYFLYGIQEDLSRDEISLEMREL